MNPFEQYKQAREETDRRFRVHGRLWNDAMNDDHRGAKESAVRGR